MALRPPISFSSSTSATRIELHAVHGNRDALLETDVDLLLAVGRFLRRIVVICQVLSSGALAGVLEFAALVADVPQVAVAAVDLLAARGDGMPRFSA